MPSTGSSQMISFGFEADGPGDADPLALPAGELVGIAARMLRGESDPLEQPLT